MLDTGMSYRCRYTSLDPKIPMIDIFVVADDPIAALTIANELLPDGFTFDSIKII